MHYEDRWDDGYSCIECNEKEKNMGYACDFLAGYMENLISGNKIGALEDLDEARSYIGMSDKFYNKFYEWAMKNENI